MGPFRAPDRLKVQGLWLTAAQGVPSLLRSHHESHETKKHTKNASWVS